MTKYIENFKGVDLLTQTEDDLHTMSYFKYFKDKILEFNKNILDDLDYEYEDLIITNMWANIIAQVVIIHRILIQIIFCLVYFI